MNVCIGIGGMMVTEENRSIWEKPARGEGWVTNRLSHGSTLSIERGLKCEISFHRPRFTCFHDADFFLRS